MKRCPQCEFIYEDEQVACDMDGAILNLDSTNVVAADQRSKVKSFAVPAIVGTALAAVLCLGFYSSPLLLATPDAGQAVPEQAASGPATAPTSIPTDVEMPSPMTSPASTEPARDEQEDNVRTSANHANRGTSDSRLTIQRGLPPLPRVPTLPRLPPAQVKKSPAANEKGQGSTSPAKKPSKVESFLKKTGRVITKPFKF